VTEQGVLRGRGVEAFLGALGSSAPAPGGGAAAGLTAAAGAALIEMVANLTVDKRGYEEVRDAMRELIGRAGTARERLIELAERDATAFESVIEAFRMPKATDEEKEARSRAIQAGYASAALVPLEMVREAVGLMDGAVEATQSGNVQAASDGLCAAYLLQAGARCAAANVEINAAAIRDEGTASALRSEVGELLARADRYVEEASRSFAARLAS
jgi:formiminotetrahydrofolate cyclodeaminase